MSKPSWFRPWGWIYRPTHAIGWVITILALLFCADIFAVVDMHSHSVSDTFYGIFPYVVPAFGVWLWIASNTAKAGSGRRA